MALISALESNYWLFLLTTGIVSISVGSFLNVVIYRLPILMENAWRSECREFLEIKDSSDQKREGQNTQLTLSKPHSSCPSCGHKIRFWENIPVISYILLGGKCAGCRTHISIQYPAIELLTLALSMVVAIQFNATIETLFALFFTWALICLTLIDAKTQLLPDSITLPLLWSGLLVNSFSVFTDLQSAVLGAAFGYLILWSIYQLFKLVTGKEGMGFGDFKLLAALGAWMGWQLLPQIILLSSFVGAIVGIAMIVITRHDRNNPIPFGPYLATAGWIAFIWGNDINRLWFNF